MESTPHCQEFSVSNHDHGHSHSHDDQSVKAPEEFWEDFYSTDTKPWTGNPNEVLVNAVAALDLPKGSDAVDLGCGSGADAVFLAQRGFSVTAVDIAAAALNHGIEAAQAAGQSEAITWLQANLASDFPSGSWDLVVSSYLHSPVALERHQILTRARDAVRPGGALVIIGHDGVPHWDNDDDRPVPEFPSIDEVIADLGLDGPGWTVIRRELVPIMIEWPGREPVERTDSLIVAIAD